MALTILVTKKSVTKWGDALWDITLNMICSELEVEKINKDFTIHYGTGQDPETTIKNLQIEMQLAINDYKGEQVILNHPKLDIGVTYLNNNLTG
jgi:hypothetical protein